MSERPAIYNTNNGKVLRVEFNKALTTGQDSVLYSTTADFPRKTQSSSSPATITFATSKSPQGKGKVR